MLALLSGEDGWADIFTWTGSRRVGLTTFLTLPHGIPSRDCIRRVISRLNPHQVLRLFCLADDVSSGFTPP